MGLLHSTAMVVGIIIGASVFVQPSEINRHVPNVPGVLSVWIAAGILTLFGSLVCAELSSAFPRTGGVYVFLKETLSPACGFLWGWAMFWSAHSGIIAASSMILARYAAYFVRLNDLGIRAVAIGAILLLSFVNYLGVRQGSLLQTIVTAAKVAVIAVLLAMVLVLGVPADRPASIAAEPAVPFREFVLAVSAALFAFGGWHMVTYTAGETRQPEKTIPRALLIGSVTVTACYVALNAAYLYLLPLNRVISSPRVAADAAYAMAGPRGASIVSALLILGLWRSQWRDSGRTAHLFRHGPGRPCLPLARGDSSAISHAAPRHPDSGGLVLRAGRNLHLPRSVHTRNLYGVAVLRSDDRGAAALAAPSGPYAGLSRLGISLGSALVYRGCHRGRGDSDSG